MTINRWLLIILCAGLGLRLGYVFTAGPGFAYDDEAAYHNAALQPRSPDGWLRSQTREPLYPALITAVYRVAGPRPAAVRVFQALLSAATIYLLFLLVRALFGAGAGILAGGITAAYPYFIFYSAYLLRETLLTFLAVLILWLLISSRRRPALFYAASAAAAAAVLAKVTFLPFWVLVLAVMLARRELPFRRLAAGTALFALCLAPLAASNYFRTGSVFLVRGQMFNAYAPLILPLEKYGAPDENALLYRDPVYARGRSLPVDRQDAYFKRAVLDELREHPGNFLRRTAWRFFKLWRVVPHAGMNYAHGAGLVFWASVLSFGIAVPLAAAGTILTAYRFRELYPLYLLPAVFSLVHALSWSQIRYRLPLEPVVIAFAAAAAAALHRRLTSRREN